MGVSPQSPVPRATRWTLTVRPNPAATLRLLCFPHAGAGASIYSRWGAALTHLGVEVSAVQYPGRENRLGEEPVITATVMVQRLADEWASIAGGLPCAFYGHSMGAMLCFELALELARRGLAPEVVRVFVSGENPPHVRTRLPAFDHLNDRDFLAMLGGRYGHIPPEVLASDDLVEMIAGILRADFKLVDSYSLRCDERLRTPLHILAGTEDPWTSADHLPQWQRYVWPSISIHWVNGDHSFPQRSDAEVLTIICAQLNRPESRHQ